MPQRRFATPPAREFSMTDKISTAQQRIAQAGLVGRTMEQIDALVRALGSWRHWSATAFARSAHLGSSHALDRLHAQAAGERDQAQAATLIAAYRLFEADALHDAYLDICQDAGIDAESGALPAKAAA
jgi:hypothetical protein